MAFVPLFCRSHFSQRGVAAPADLVRRARALGYNTLGLCDEATMAGFLSFEDACRDQGIRPVFGARLFMQGLSLKEQTFAIDFLIETEQGYRNLVRLMTRYHQSGTGGHQPLVREDISQRTGGLVAIVPPDGELGALLELRDRARTQDFLMRIVELFGPQTALGIGDPGDESAGLVMRLASFLRIHGVAATPVEYTESGDAAAAVWLANPRQAPGRSWTPPADVKALPAMWSEDEVLARWTGDIEEAPHETGNIARRCTWRPGRIRRVYPVRDLERGFDPNSYLFDLVIRGATQRYGEIGEQLKLRINREIEDVKANNLAPYLLLNHDISGALDKLGVSRGVGRGRMVASVLAYCLGITRIDPLEYNLVAKSLLPEGETCPALSIEIPRGGVEPLLGWLREHFGAEHLAEIGRVQEARRDQILAELALWAGMTEDEKKLAQRQKNRARSSGAAARLSEGSKPRRWRDPAFLGDLAVRLSPRPRPWIGAGDKWVLSGEPLEYIVPVVESSQNRPVTGIEEKAIDRLGLARISFVPHGLLDILDQTMRLARAQQPGFEFGDIPLDDSSAYELLSRGDTSGIPPLEPISVRALLRRHRPRNLLQLLRVKTEAGVAEGGPRELGDELPDVLLSYQCAFLKANYPLAFYGAAIGAAVEHRGNPAAIIREARRAGFRVHGPDINLSDWDTTLSGGGIRLGLAAVRGVGQRAWENIHAVRSGGLFTSLEDFCERIDMRVVGLRPLRALIASGAMDSIESNRAAMDQTVVRLQKRVRERSAEEARREVQATLFDMDEIEEEEAPQAEEKAVVEDWNPWERRQRECEAIGFFFSVDPISRYKIALGHLRPLPIEKVSPRASGRLVRIAGLVCGAEMTTRIAGRQGQALIDLEGLPVWLPRTLAEISSYCLEPGTEVLVIGDLNKSENYLHMDAVGLWRLADLEDQATKVASVRLSLAGENRQTLKLLFTLARQFRGSTTLELDGFEGRKGFLHGRLARTKVFFCSPFYQGLCKILPLDAIELFGANGEPLLVKAPQVDDEDELESEIEPEAEIAEPEVKSETAEAEAKPDNPEG
ncbi:PHP domain-containing protein [bacterium]|nr:PHP domain-containing protein [bacterium]